MFDGPSYHGVASARTARARKEFEAAVDRATGERVRSDGAFGTELYRALAGVEWRSGEGAVVNYSSREAGALVVWVFEDGCYMDWYGSHPVGVVAPWIGEAMAAEGWTFRCDADHGKEDLPKPHRPKQPRFPASPHRHL